MQLQGNPSDGAQCRVCGRDPDGSCGVCHAPACAQCVSLISGPLGAIAVCEPCAQADVAGAMRRRVFRDVAKPALTLLLVLAGVLIALQFLRS